MITRGNFQWQLGFQIERLNRFDDNRGLSECSVFRKCIDRGAETGDGIVQRKFHTCLTILVSLNPRIPIQGLREINSITNFSVSANLVSINTHGNEIISHVVRKKLIPFENVLIFQKVLSWQLHAAFQSQPSIQSRRFPYFLSQWLVPHYWNVPYPIHDHSEITIDQARFCLLLCFSLYNIGFLCVPWQLPPHSEHLIIRCFGYFSQHAECVWQTYCKSAASIVTIIRHKIFKFDVRKPTPSLCAQQQINRQIRIFAIRIKVDLSICQVLDLIFKQYHHGQPRSLVAGFYHFQNTVIGDRQTDDRRNWFPIRIRCDDVKLCPATRRILLCVGYDFDLHCIDGLPKDQAFSQWLTPCIPHGCHEHTGSRIRRSESGFSQTISNVNKSQFSDFSFALT